MASRTTENSNLVESVSWGEKSAVDKKTKPVKKKQERALSKIVGTGKQEILSFAYPEKYAVECRSIKTWLESRNNF